MRLSGCCWQFYVLLLICCTVARERGVIPSKLRCKSTLWKRVSDPSSSLPTLVPVWVCLLWNDNISIVSCWMMNSTDASVKAQVLLSFLSALFSLELFESDPSLFHPLPSDIIRCHETLQCSFYVFVFPMWFQWSESDVSSASWLGTVAVPSFTSIPRSNITA